ncbi:MAG: Na+/H+ antiporter subunit E [Clostridia bacterium]|nr:Na+/H+ antiporter subunit E [Clostridia bacterium]
MFIAYFVLFVMFNGKLTVEIAVFGLVFAVLLTAFSCKFLGYSLKKDLDMVRGLGAGIRYLVMLTREILKANLMVIRMILTPGFEPKPQLIQFRSGLKQEGHRVALADSITLTPGTITCELNDDLFTVHCLDTAQREGIEEICFLQSLKAMEERAEERELSRQKAETPETDTPADDVESGSGLNESEHAGVTEDTAEDTETEAGTVPETDEETGMAEAETDAENEVQEGEQ